MKSDLPLPGPVLVNSLFAASFTSSPSLCLSCRNNDPFSQEQTLLQILDHLSSETLSFIPSVSLQVDSSLVRVCERERAG